MARSSTALIQDEKYRNDSLNAVLENTSRKFSLVDQVIRSMLSDPGLLVHGFLGFNPKDFYDICDSRGIEMLYRPSGAARREVDD